MDKIKFIAIEQLLEMMENKEQFKLVEVLSPESYKEGHIPGAINLPFDKVNELAPKHLKKTDAIIVYCANYHCQASTKATRALLDIGYLHTVDFKAGKQGWENAGLDLEK